MVFNFMYPFLDALFKPLFYLKPIVSILIFSFLISVVLTFSYAKLTDQKRMRSIQDEIKKLQIEFRKQMHDPKKAKKVQQKLMLLNSEYMKLSFRPMLYTTIPIIIFFGWMTARFSYYDINLNQPFNVTLYFKSSPDNISLLTKAMVLNQYNETKNNIIKSITYTLRMNTSESNLHIITYKDGIKYDNDFNLIIHSKDKSMPKYINEKTNPLKKIILDYPKVYLDLGFIKLSALWTYIIFSMIFSMAIRKIFKIV